MTERNVTIGGGPFQPPSASELTLLRSEVATLKSDLERAKARTRELNALMDVETANDLSALLSRVLPENGGVTVDNDIDGDLEVTVEGLTVNSDGIIVQPEREFEVTSVIRFEHRATITAKDEDEARDIYTDALDSELMDIDVHIYARGVEDQDTYHPDIDQVSVNEL